MRINNIDIDFDIDFVDDMKKYEKGLKKFLQDSNFNGRATPQEASQMCYVVKELFVTCFGEDATAQVLGERLKVSLCMSGIT